MAGNNGGIMSQLGDLNKLRKQAKQMQQELAAEEITVDEGDISEGRYISYLNILASLRENYNNRY